MPLFNGLPNEIIIRVIEVTSAGDIVSLALCCKHFSALAQKRLAFHRKQRAIAPDIVIGFFFRSLVDPLLGQTQDQDHVAGQKRKEPPIIHPLKHLQDILEDDDCRFYTRVMRIGSLDLIELPVKGEEKEIQDDEEEKRRVQAIVELLDHVKTQYGHKVTALVANVYSTLLQYLGKYDMKKWTNMIKNGIPAAVIFLLLTLYPNLETLEIYDPEGTWSNKKEWGGLLISLIDIAKRPDTNKLRLFSRFLEFVLQGYDDIYLEARAQLAVPFMELPSMRKIFGRVVHGRRVQWTAGVGTSKVIHLDLGGDIDRTSLRNLVCGCKGLESFKYRLSPHQHWEWADDLRSLKWGPQAENDVAWEDSDSGEPETEGPCPEHRTEAERPRWKPRGIVMDLLLYASHSLISLDLTAGNLDGVVKLSNDEPFIDSLHSFRALTSVHLDTMMLFKKVKCSSKGLEVLREPKQHILWENMRPHRLVDFLPVTIEEFGMTSLMIGQGLSREDVVEMFTGLPDDRNRLPRLFVINVVRKRNRQSKEEQDGWQELRVNCGKNDMKLFLREPVNP